MAFWRKCECIKLCEFHKISLNSWKRAIEKNYSKHRFFYSLKCLGAGYMENFISSSQDEMFYRISSLWSFLCNLHVWVIRKKIISVKWDPAIMKTRSCFYWTFFIDQERMIFWFIHDNKNVQTHAKKLSFLKFALIMFFQKNGCVSKDTKYWRKTAIYTDE